MHTLASCTLKCVIMAIQSYLQGNRSYKIRKEYLSAEVGQQQPSYNISFSAALLDLIQILNDCPRPSLTASKLVGSRDQLPWANISAFHTSENGHLYFPLCCQELLALYEAANQCCTICCWHQSALLEQPSNLQFPGSCGLNLLGKIRSKFEANWRTSQDLTAAWHTGLGMVYLRTS